MEEVKWIDEYSVTEVRERRQFNNGRAPMGAKCFICPRDALFIWYQFCLCDSCFQKMLEKISKSKEGEIVVLETPKQHGFAFNVFARFFSLF